MGCHWEVLNTDTCRPYSNNAVADTSLNDMKVNGPQLGKSVQGGW